MVISSLVALVPIKKHEDHNISRIQRTYNIEPDRLIHIGSGSNTGIIVYRNNEGEPECNPDIILSFTVWLSDGDVTRKQENRILRFCLNENAEFQSGAAAVRTFFAHLLNNLPKDNGGFVMRAMKLLHSGFGEIDSIEIEMKYRSEEEALELPNTSRYEEKDLEMSAARVQELLEHAFPNGLSIPVLAQRLNIPEEQITEYLNELESGDIVQRVDDEWIRRDVRNVDGILACHRGELASNKMGLPTIAIITHLFAEKQAVDSIIEDAQVIHRFKSGSDSNAYTIGNIGKHCVVAIKLPITGDSREAATAAGSITTRLLGHFQNIEHVFIVGVGGAVPQYTDAKLHPRLGDVVVSGTEHVRGFTYTFAYDVQFNEDLDNITKFSVNNYAPTSDRITRIIFDGGEYLQQSWSAKTTSIISKINNSEAAEKEFIRPDPDTDILCLYVGGGNVVVMPHPNQDRTHSIIHVGTVGAVSSRVHMENKDEDEGAALIRDIFASEYKVRALDAGFDSVVSAIEGSRIDSWTLIRGIADYENGHSRAAKLWQPYAAATAAALAQTIISHL